MNICLRNYNKCKNINAILSIVMFSFFNGIINYGTYIKALEIFSIDNLKEERN